MLTVAVLRCLRRLGGLGRVRVGEGGRWGLGSVGGRVEIGRRKGSSGSCRGIPGGGEGSEVGGRSESWVRRFLQSGAMRMVG